MNKSTTENPVIVEVTRGGMVESRHRGAISIMRSDGHAIASLGDVDRLIYPRSAIKPSPEAAWWRVVTGVLFQSCEAMAMR